MSIITKHLSNQATVHAKTEWVIVRLNRQPDGERAIALSYFEVLEMYKFINENLPFFSKRLAQEINDLQNWTSYITNAYADLIESMPPEVDE